MKDTATLEPPAVTPPASSAPAPSPQLMTSTTETPDSHGDSNGTEAPSRPAGQSRKRSQDKPKPQPKRETATTQSDAHTGERLNEHGLVRVNNQDVLARVPLYYYTERNKWYAPNGAESFGYYPDGNAKSLLAEYGFNRKIPDAQGNTAADRATLWLMQNHSVCYAGALAGHRAGLHEIEGARILVTETPRFVEPKSGNWPTIRLLIETLFDDDAHDQKSIFYLWAAESFRAFYQRMTQPGPWPFRHCPALAVFGPRLCGKTALIELVLTPLFGGKKGDPMTYMREKRFNKDLFGAALLVLDDKGASSNLTERRERGEAVKDLIGKPMQRREGKGADAINLPPFWRLVMAGNDDDSGLQLCPALSPRLEDKITLLRARQAHGLPETHDENDAWAKVIRKELPAFAASLLEYRPLPAAVLDHRTRVINFWHPSLVTGLRDMQPAIRLRELIDTFGLVPASAPQWEGTATEFECAMKSRDSEGITARLFGSPQAAGKMLSELARIVPDRVQRTNPQNTHLYRIKA